jgi:purine nucleosidase
MVDARKVVIDCDPGIDDAVALLLAFASPEEIDLRAITTVAGNVPAKLTEANARRIRDLARRPEVPVYAGCTRPLLRPLVVAEHIHGESGLDGGDLPPAAGKIALGHAVDRMIEEVMGAPGEVTIVAVGPLTNLAMAIVKCPELVEQAADIVVMGGAAGAGNVTPHAEFNFYVDPHAARIVFEAGAVPVMHGLDVTRKARADEDWLAGMVALGSDVGRAVAGMLSFYGKSGGAGLHDVLAVGWLLWPELFTARPARVEIITDDVPEIGQSRVTFGAPDAPDTEVVTDIDAPVFLRRLAERLARLG